MWFATVGAAVGAVDARAHRLAGRDRAVLEHDGERLVAVEAVRLDHGGAAGLASRWRRVRHLAAALGIERRAAQLHEQAAVAELLDGLGGRLDVEVVVARELGAEAGLAGERRGDLALLAALRRLARAPALGVHQRGEAGLVDGEAVLGRRSRP